MVDKSRGEKLVVNIDIDFPRVPCYSQPLLLLLSDRRDSNSAMC